MPSGCVSVDSGMKPSFCASGDDCRRLQSFDGARRLAAIRARHQPIDLMFLITREK